MRFDCWSVEYAYDVLVPSDKEIRKELYHTNYALSVGTVDGHNGASERLKRGCGTVSR